MILKHILYKYISICTTDSVLAFLNRNTVLFRVWFYTYFIRLLLAYQLNEQQEINITSKFSETLYNTYKLYQKPIRIK